MKTSQLFNIFCSLLISSILISCGKESSFSTPDSKTQSSLDIPDEPAIDENPEPPIVTSKPTICSDLSFNNVAWPTSLTDFHVNIFALAMNISGSFEGHTGWTNLTNNFDGQGISLGLFNQNLGQGSLQPMMIELKNNHQAKMREFYSDSQYNSVQSMLTKWGGVSNALSKVSSYSNSYDSDFSDLDDPDAINASGDTDANFLEKASNSKNQASVDWAVATVFKGTSFKPEWKKSLQKMAGSPEFITIQVKAAKAIHEKALRYMKKFGFKEMRAYFFFFDVVVQNGGISNSIATKYIDWEKSNKAASESAKLKKLLEFRLSLVIPKYKADVRSRKLAVINGAGTVHGEKRNFSTEYCSPQWATVFPKSSLP